jgi:hypothetical protein
MKHKDMRSLPRAAQEERRRQVIGLRESGMGLAAIGRQVGLSQTGVFNICQRYRGLGVAGLRGKPHGSPVGTTRQLSAAPSPEGLPDNSGLMTGISASRVARTVRQPGHEWRIANCGGASPCRALIWISDRRDQDFRLVLLS